MQTPFIAWGKATGSAFIYPSQGLTFAKRECGFAGLQALPALGSLSSTRNTVLSTRRNGHDIKTFLEREIFQFKLIPPDFAPKKKTGFGPIRPLRSLYGPIRPLRSLYGPIRPLRSLYGPIRPIRPFTRLYAPIREAENPEKKFFWVGSSRGNFVGEGWVT